MDASTSTTITVNIRGDGTTGPTCTSYTVDGNGTIVGHVGPVTNTTTSFLPKALGASGLTGGYHVFVVCGHLTNSNTAVGTVSWTP
jgi:hypothetical protein